MVYITKSRRQITNFKRLFIKAIRMVIKQFQFNFHINKLDILYLKLIQKHKPS